MHCQGLGDWVLWLSQRWGGRVPVILFDALVIHCFAVLQKTLSIFVKSFSTMSSA